MNMQPSFSCNTNVPCPPNVVSAPSPRQGEGYCFHSPIIESALISLAALGCQPVHPDVIIQYLPPCLNIAGASLCPPGNILIYLPLCLSLGTVKLGYMQCKIVFRRIYVIPLSALGVNVDSHVP